MEQKIHDIIKDAEMILIGIGDEFSPKYSDTQSKGNSENRVNDENRIDSGKKSDGLGQIADPLALYRRSSFYSEISQEHEVIQAYNKLREMIGAKPYFVVTMNTDDLIYSSGLEQDLIVAPCGSMQKMQCAEHIVEAAAIRERILNRANSIKLEEPDSETWQEEAQRIIQEEALCPVCGAPLSFHTIETEGYLEEGYLPQWNKYTKWLSCTLNRKLCVLELGVGFKFPQVIRFPFEKVAAYNKKASLIRVNSKFPQLPEEMSQRGVSIAESPVQFLLNF